MVTSGPQATTGKKTEVEQQPLGEKTGDCKTVMARTKREGLPQSVGQDARRQSGQGHRRRAACWAGGRARERSLSATRHWGVGVSTVTSPRRLRQGSHAEPAVTRSNRKCPPEAPSTRFRPPHAGCPRPPLCHRQLASLCQKSLNVDSHGAVFSVSFCGAGRFHDSPLRAVGCSSVSEDCRRCVCAWPVRPLSSRSRSGERAAMCPHGHLWEEVFPFSWVGAGRPAQGRCTWASQKPPQGLSPEPQTFRLLSRPPHRLLRHPPWSLRLSVWPRHTLVTGMFGDLPTRKLVGLLCPAGHVV